jgi:hypothetical protein
VRGFLEAGLRRTPGVKVEFLSRALEVLEWGRTAWKKVPVGDRGVIFEDTFIHGLRAMHLNALMEVCLLPPCYERSCY